MFRRLQLGACSALMLKKHNAKKFGNSEVNNEGTQIDKTKCTVYLFWIYIEDVEASIWSILYKSSPTIYLKNEPLLKDEKKGFQRDWQPSVLCLLVFFFSSDKIGHKDLSGYKSLLSLEAEAHEWTFKSRRENVRPKCLLPFWRFLLFSQWHNTRDCVDKVWRLSKLHKEIQIQFF